MEPSEFAYFSIPLHSKEAIPHCDRAWRLTHAFIAMEKCGGFKAYAEARQTAQWLSR